jgi:hypothetical protein
MREIANGRALYNEIWAEPMTTVAQRYGLSDVDLRMICVELDVPLPPRGYCNSLILLRLGPTFG